MCVLYGVGYIVLVHGSVRWEKVRTRDAYGGAAGAVPVAGPEDP